MPERRLHFGFSLLCAAALVVVAACSDSRSARVSPVDELLVQRWPAVAASSTKGATGAERARGGGFRVVRAPLRATLPAAGNGASEVSLGDHGAFARILREGASAAPGVLDRGIVVYEGGDVDAVVFGTKEGIEELLVVHRDVDSIVYDVDLPGGYALRQASLRSVEIVDGEGIARLRASAPRGWDGNGAEIALELRANERRLELIAPRGAPLPLLLDPIWTSTKTLVLARSQHTATLLPNGKILLAGGTDGPIPQGTTELYDPRTGTFTAAPKMSVPRVDHTATLLRTGKVLIAGGSGSAASASSELYDPVSETFTPGPMMAARRSTHTATLLADGRVLVAGGTASPTQPEIFDPATAKFSSTATATTARSNHTATRLVTGEVLLLGGTVGAALTPPPNPVAEIFDPTTGQLTPAKGAPTPRASHTATLLPNGKVLAASGLSLANADVYDPATGDVTPVPTMARNGHIAALLPNGLVVLAGGSALEMGPPTIELFDYSLNQVTATADVLTENRQRFTATILPGGDVALIGGNSLDSGVTRVLQTIEIYASETGGGSSIAATLARKVLTPRLTPLLDGTVLVSGGSAPPATPLDVYDPITNTFLRHADMATGRAAHTATLLGNGKVLIAGGTDNATPLDSAELWGGTSTTPTGKLRGTRTGHAAVRLTSGKVLVVGGQGPQAQTAELYDPAIGVFAATGAIAAPRADPRAVLLETGEVLVVGGNDTQGKAVATAETYDPLTGQFTPTSPMAVPRAAHAATLLASGKALVVGGGTPTAELYDSSTRKFTLTSAPMAFSRTSHTATLLPSGKVLVLGGKLGSTLMISDELYDPKLDRFVPSPNGVFTLLGHTATLLTTGDVFIAGGISQTLPMGNAACSLWTAGTLPVDPTRRPFLAPPPSGATASGILALSGARFTGPHEASGGTTGSSPTDAPLALWMPISGGLLSGSLSEWTPTTAKWSIPATSLTGPGMLFVATNGAVSPAAMLSVGAGAAGVVCTHDLDCASRHCADGVCCDTSCLGLCMACSAKKLGGGADGTCRPLPLHADPDAECPMQAASTCARSGGCNGAGACAKYADGTSCGPGGTCKSGVCAASAIGAVCIDDVTARDAQGNVHPCGPYRCRDAACVGRCTSTTDCVAAMQCTAAGDCAAPAGDDATQPGCVCALGRPGARQPTNDTTALAALFAVLAAAAVVRRRSAHRA